VSRSPSERRLAARIAGLALHALGGSRDIAARARRGFDQRFLREAKRADPTLTGSALEAKVHSLRKLYFAGLAYSSVKARRKKQAFQRTGLGPVYKPPATGPP
jgi:hypothetical protein